MTRPIGRAPSPDRSLSSPASRALPDSLPGDAFLVQLDLQLDDKLVDNLMDHRGRQMIEPDDVVEAVTELRRKDLLISSIASGLLSLLNKANRFTLGFPHPGVGGHHQHHVAEVRFTAVIIGQRPLSITCSSRLNTSGCAFSISSSSNTACGCLITASVSSPP